MEEVVLKVLENVSAEGNTFDFNSILFIYIFFRSNYNT